MKTYYFVEFEKIRRSRFPKEHAYVFDKLLRIADKSYDGNSNYGKYFLRPIRKDAKNPYILVGNYVGTIPINKKVSVEILPKVDLVDDDDDYSGTKKMLLEMLKYYDCDKFKDVGKGLQSVADLTIWDYLISIYLQRVRKLVGQGLQSQYIEVNENIHHYKGKLDVANHLRHNIVHAERFYVTYDEFSKNCAENKIIKATLLKLCSITTLTKNKNLVKQLLEYFSDVDASVNYYLDFSNVSVNSRSKIYKPIIEWSKVFLNDKDFNAFSSDANTIDTECMMFPMERLFEQFVFKLIKEKCKGKSYSVDAQVKGYIFDISKKFQLIPDIVVKKDGRTIVLDTKWKELNPQKGNYDIEQKDIYQLYAYSHRFDSNTVWLLYPNTSKIKKYLKNKNQEFIKLESTNDTNIYAYFIDFSNIDASIERLVDIM